MVNKKIYNDGLHFQDATDAVFPIVRNTNFHDINNCDLIKFKCNFFQSFIYSFPLLEQALILAWLAL